MKNLNNFKILMQFLINKNIEKLINWKLYDISISVTSLNIEKKKILEENNKIRNELKNCCYIMKDIINENLYEIFYVINNFKGSLVNNLFNIKES
jgi:hypothetical protein